MTKQKVCSNSRINEVFLLFVIQQVWYSAPPPPDALTRFKRFSMFCWVNPLDMSMVHIMNNWAGGNEDNGFFITVRFDATLQYHQLRVEGFYAGQIREGQQPNRFQKG